VSKIQRGADKEKKIQRGKLYDEKVGKTMVGEPWNHG